MTSIDLLIKTIMNAFGVSLCMQTCFVIITLGVKSPSSVSHMSLHLTKKYQIPHTHSLT